MKAREQLSLLNMENWLPGRGPHAKACGIKSLLNPTGDFGPKVCRVFYSGPEVLSSELSGPAKFRCIGPVSLARRKKRLCHNSKIGFINRSVAILALRYKPFACETAIHRDFVRTGSKNAIMVIIGLVNRSNDPEDQDMDDNELPDRTPGHQGEEDWQLASYEEAELRLRENLKARPVHPADVVSIGTKSNAIPLKDVDNEIILGYTGRYCGHNEKIPALKTTPSRSNSRIV